MGAVLLTTLLQLGVIYLPFAQKIFYTTALTLGELGICLGFGLMVFVVVEVAKWVKRRRLAR